jgi:multiple sugar transport system permease protein
MNYLLNQSRASVSGRRWPGWLLSAFLILAGIVMLVPVVWVVLQSFETPAEQSSVAPIWVPHQVTFGSYRALFSSAPFLENIFNSVLVTVAVVVGAAVVSVLAAYAFARLEFRGREVLFTLFLAAITLPGQVSAVPEFVVVKYLPAEPDHPRAGPGHRHLPAKAAFPHHPYRP